MGGRAEAVIPPCARGSRKASRGGLLAHTVLHFTQHTQHTAHVRTPFDVPFSSFSSLTYLDANVQCRLPHGHNDTIRSFLIDEVEKVARRKGEEVPEEEGQKIPVSERVRNMHSTHQCTVQSTQYAVKFSSPLIDALLSSSLVFSPPTSSLGG